MPSSTEERPTSGRRDRVARVVPTAAERQALLTATIRIQDGSKTVDPRSALRDWSGWVVVPDNAPADWRRGRRSTTTESFLETLADTRKDLVEHAAAAMVGLPGGEATGAVALLRPSRSAVTRAARAARVPYWWSVRADGLRVAGPGWVWPVTARPAETGDGLAARRGPTLPEALDALHASGSPAATWRRWTASTRPGWVPGGDLSLACRRCGTPLRWLDWQHPNAPAHTRNAWVYCPEHPDDAALKPTARTRNLVTARRQLDQALADQARRDRRTGGSPSGTCQVYVLGLTDEQGNPVEDVYVGQTSRDPVERLEEHRNGIRAAPVLRRRGLNPVTLRPDLLPPLPTLTSQEAALTAEAWTAAWLRTLGHEVLGGH